MTIICEFCGCENHLEADFCNECGKPIKKDQVYVVCSICGISNPNTAATCIACGEPLDEKSSFVIENKKNEKSEVILSEEAAGVVPKPKEIKAKKEKRKPKVLLWILIAALILSGITTVFFMFFNEQVYLEAADGFYYVTSDRQLRYIDGNNKDVLLLGDATDVNRVEKYGKDVYFEVDKTLYHNKNGTTFTVANEVSDFKVNIHGDRVLYTVSKENALLGDLYLYENQESIRIDSKVGLGRYIFSDHDSSIYYVTDITSEEDLGNLYLKRGDAAPEKIAEDVFTPVFSFKKGEVHFVREDINLTEKYDLYFAKAGKITEVARNIIHMIIEIDSEEVLLIQEKNDVISFIMVKRDDTEILDSKINQYGIYSYDDIEHALVLTEKLQLFYQKNMESFILSNGESRQLSYSFDDYVLSKDEKYIYTILDNELLISKFKDTTISETISLESNAILKQVSDSGQSAIYEVNGTLYFMSDGYKKMMEQGVDKILITENEKYLAYKVVNEGYVYKIGAKTPVILGSNITDIFVNDRYVYTLVDGGLFRYKLGKFSSNQLINTVEELHEFTISY